LDEVRGLAHSVLFDVYDSLSGMPASLTARRLVAGRAQHYLDKLARESGGDPSLARELAESYLRLGDVLGRPYTPNLGDTTSAIESYRKAQALLEQATQRAPRDAAIQERLCETYICVTRALMREMQPVPAVESGRKAVALAESLCARFPHEPAYREKLAGAYLSLGETQYVAAGANGSAARFQEVLATYRKSVEVLESFAPQGGKSWEIWHKTGLFHRPWRTSSREPRLAASWRQRIRSMPMAGSRRMA
jgi:tetratricopeptide (TPR) repeat protein